MTWLPVPGWAGRYEVSDGGEVRSIDRPGFKGRTLKQGSAHGGYRTVVLSRPGERHAYTVHRLVAEAFLGPKPTGHHTRHLNGDKSDNSAANLAYGAASQNELDKVAHGRNPLANRTHCPQGHEYTEDNTMRDGDRHRSCRTCHRERVRRYRARTTRKALRAA
jgi:hypothetical protein